MVVVVMAAAVSTVEAVASMAEVAVSTAAVSAVVVFTAAVSAPRTCSAAVVMAAIARSTTAAIATRTIGRISITGITSDASTARPTIPPITAIRTATAGWSGPITGRTGFADIARGTIGTTAGIIIATGELSPKRNRRPIGRLFFLTEVSPA